MPPDPRSFAEAKVFLDYTQEQLDLVFDQRAWAANAQEVIARFATASADARARLTHEADLPYGAGPDERLDWFSTSTPGAPVHIHFHGGAWRALGKADASFVAPGFVASGAHVLAPDFTNLPMVRLPDMVDQVRRVVVWAHREAMRLGWDRHRLTVSGHSSGAHLAAVLLTTDWTAFGLPADAVKGAICVSGSYDLEPVLISSRRHYIELSTAEAAALSPAKHLGNGFGRVVIAHAEGDSPEFRRQALAFADAARTAGRAVEAATIAGVNHFEIAECLAKVGHPLHRAALRLVHGGPCRIGG